MYTIDYKEKTDYYENLWKTRIKCALKYKNITQNELAKLLHKSQNSISKWLAPKGTNPTIADFLIICEVLQIDLNYFFDASITLDNAFSSKNFVNRKKQSPYIETSILRKIFFLIKSTVQQKCVSMVSSPPGIGVTTALKLYKMENFYNSILINGYEFVNFNWPSFTNDMIILVDNANNLSDSQITQIIYKNNEQKRFAIIFFGENILEKFKTFSFFSQITIKVKLDYPDEGDIKKIILNSFPSIDELSMQSLISVSKYQLLKICAILSVLKNLCKENKIKNPSFENIQQAISLNGFL